MRNNTFLPGLLLAFSLGVTLVNSHHFVYQTLTSFFLFTLSVGLLLGYAGIQMIKKQGWIQLPSNYTLLSFVVWGVFVGLHALFLKAESGNLKEWLIVSYAIFYLALFFLLSFYPDITRWVFLFLLGLVLLEALICIVQLVQGKSGYSAYFPVTGSQVNPNLTAMFIAMVFPVMVMLSFDKHKWLRQLSFASIGFALIALLLLKCRTAWLGASVASLLVLNAQFQLTTWLLQAGKKWITWIIIPLALVVIVSLSTILYQAKRASADGRKTIWSISWQLIKEKPLIGYGYGLFDRHFNLQQATYFAQGKGTEQEKANASYVHMAYNEYLENTVEGGLVGGLLFIAVLATAIFSYFQRKAKTREQTAALAGVGAFAVMSLVNFTVQAVPVMSVLVLYTALLSLSSVSSTQQPDFSISIGSPKWLGAFLLLLAFGFGWHQMSTMKGFLEQKKAVGLLNEGKGAEAIQLLANVESNLSRCESYHVLYGKALLMTGNYSKAIPQFLLATHYTSQPDVFYYLGHCYEKLNQPQLAEKYYQQALNIVPSRFTPRYALMQLYVQQGQLNKALGMADSIRNLSVKVPSKEVDFIQQAAYTVLKTNHKL